MRLIPHLAFILLLVSTNSASAIPDCGSAARLVEEGAKLNDGSEKEEKYYRDAIASCPQMADAFLNLSVMLSKKNLLDEAIDNARKAVSIRDDSRFRLALARYLVEKDNLLEAEEQYSTILKNDPKNVKALQGISVVYEKKQQFDDAIRVLTQASEEDPKDWLSFFNLGAIYDRQGKSDEALTSYSKAISLKPDEFSAQYFLGLSLWRLGKFDEAVEPLEKSAELNNKNPKVFQALGVVHQSRKDYSKAELAFARAIEINPEDLSSAIQLAAILLIEKQPSRALEISLNVINKDPNNSRAHTIVGLCKLQLGEYENAKKSLEEAIKIDETNALAHYNLGVAYQRLGKKDEAQKSLDIANKLQPDLNKELE